MGSVETAKQCVRKKIARKKKEIVDISQILRIFIMILFFLFLEAR